MAATLAAALIDLLVEALPVLAKPGAFWRPEGLTQWERDSDNPPFWRTSEPQIGITPSVWSELESLASWAKAQELVKADPVLGRFVDQLVGWVGARGHLVQSSGLLHQALLDIVLDQTDRAGAAQRVVARWHETYGTEGPVFTTLAVVSGVDVGDEVRIGDGLSIRRMDDSEVSTALTLGLMPRQQGLPTAVMAIPTSDTCIAFQQPTPWKFGPMTDADTRAHGRLSERAAESVSRAVLALRLLPVPIWLHVTFTIAPMGMTSWNGAGVPDNGGPMFREKGVEVGDGSEVKRLMARMRRYGRKGPLRVALTRYDIAHVRADEQDRLLDAWIGMEALFGTREGEVSFRVGLNVANYVSVPGLDRRAVRMWAKGAYDVRSRVAHGGVPDLDGVMRLNGQTATSVDQVARDTLWVLRAAILRRLVDGAEPDWIGLALQPVADPTAPWLPVPVPT